MNQTPFVTFLDGEPDGDHHGKEFEEIVGCIVAVKSRSCSDS